MKLKSLLADHRSAITERWISLILETYPEDTAAFLHKEQDPFANPVGGTVRREAEAIFDVMVAGGESAALTPHLEQVVRVRAVQDFSASRAVGFVFLLKQAVRGALARVEVSPEELLRFEERIDGLALLAFDLYMQSREKMYEIRANEARRQTAFLLERVGRMEGRKERKKR